jgi:lipoprotein NlpI
VVLEPNLPEPWHQRAIARFRAGDSDGAVADIEQTLQREPRHFAAFGLLSHIAEQRGNWRGAYEAWQKLLELDPMTPGGDDRLKMLRQKALGQDL